MEKKFGLLVLGEETTKKLYTYLDAEMEARKLVKKLNKTVYIFEIYSKFEPSFKVTKIEEHRTLDICEINELFDKYGDNDSDDISFYFPDDDSNIEDDIIEHIPPKDIHDNSATNIRKEFGSIDKLPKNLD